MKTVYGVLFVLCTNLAYSQLKPIITHISQNEISEIGGQVEMTCTVSNTMDWSIVWIKFGFEKSNETIAVLTKDWTTVKDSRFSVRQDQLLDSSKYTLQIVVFYRCQVLKETIVTSDYEELKIGGPNSHNEISHIGSTVEFICTVLNTMIWPVVWIKSGFKKSTELIAISTRDWTIVKYSRFSVRQDQLLDSRKYTLQINQIQETDVGFYRCLVLNETIIASADVNLKIRGPPIIYKNSTKSMVVMEGQPAVLECYAHGSPNPKIYWRRENNGIVHVVQLIHRGNIWKIPVINKDDRGIYSCVAENGIGNGTRHRITIQVEFAPVITVPKNRKGQALKYDIDLECNIEAYPSPAIIWKHNGVQLSNNEHYTISQIAPTNEYTSSILSIKQIKNDLYGAYYCVASNQFGNAEASIHLYESAIPLTSSIRRIDTY